MRSFAAGILIVSDGCFFNVADDKPEPDATEEVEVDEGALGGVGLTVCVVAAGGGAAAGRAVAGAIDDGLTGELARAGVYTSSDFCSRLSDGLGGGAEDNASPWGEGSGAEIRAVNPWVDVGDEAGRVGVEPAEKDAVITNGGRTGSLTYSDAGVGWKTPFMLKSA